MNKKVQGCKRWLQNTTTFLTGLIRLISCMGVVDRHDITMEMTKKVVTTR